MKIFSLVSVSFLIILNATACTAWSQQRYDDGVSDQEYIQIASKTDEARAFIDLFPEAKILVDRNGQLAVDFRFDKVLPATSEQSWEGIRLRIFIDPKNKRVAGTFIQCDDQDKRSRFIEVGLIEYLEQYAKSQHCP